MCVSLIAELILLDHRTNSPWYYRSGFK